VLGIAPPHGVRYPAEAQALDRLPDADILCALHDLPDELRLAVYLADVEGYPYREIAEIMGTPVGTVASRLHHGRGRLRARLAAAAARRGLAAAPG
jgi:RNA polymerase sigma-70 factor (ECF subfamily)